MIQIDVRDLKVFLPETIPRSILSYHKNPFVCNMAELLSRPKSDLSEFELQQLEEYEFNHGPLSLLTNSIKQESTILISLRNNHKLIGKVKAFDRHCNLILMNVKEIWEETGPNKKKNLKERFIAKLFVRGDSVIVIVKYDE